MDRRAPTLPRSNGLLHEEHESAVTSRGEQGTSTSGVAATKEGGGKLAGNLPLYRRRWQLWWFLSGAARRDKCDKQAPEKTAASHSSEFAPTRRRPRPHATDHSGTMWRIAPGRGSAIGETTASGPMYVRARLLEEFGCATFSDSDSPPNDQVVTHPDLVCASRFNRENDSRVAGDVLQLPL